MKSIPLPVNCLLLFCSLVSNGQTCTSPVYNNSAGITIRGPCPSSQVFAAITSNSTVKFTCSYNHDGSYITFWKVTNIPTIYSFSIKQKGIDFMIPSGASAIMSLTIIVEKIATLQNVTEIQCGLCKFEYCTEDFVVSLPVQLISFGKPVY